MSTGGAGARAQPFHCPYCGEGELRPAGDGHHCPDCDRRFALAFLGLGAAGPATDPTTEEDT
jgi:hypothetical protein